MKIWQRISLFLALSIPISAGAVEPIKVLLAKTAGVSAADARSMLLQMNGMMANSDLGDHEFISATLELGLAKVYTASCNQTNGPALVDCARINLTESRDSDAADIVVMMVPSVANDCGNTDPDMINAATVSQLNETN